MKEKFNRPCYLVLSVILVACLTAACGKGGSKSAMAETTAAAYDVAPVAIAPEFYAAEETAASYQEDGLDNGYYEGDYAVTEEMGLDTAMVSAPAQPSPSTVNRKLIRTVSLDVETTDFDNLLSTIQSAVSTGNSYIEQSDISGTSISASPDQHRYAFLIVRIPSAGLNGFLSQMAQQSNIINRSENVQDVTLQYSDIESRKKSLTIEQERLWALLEKADTLEAVIALEERLSEIRYELEGFESQLRIYDNQVDYSTVHIRIQEVGVFTPTVPDSVGTRIQKGFIRNLNNVIRSITDFLVWFLSHLPALVMLAVIVGVLFFFTRFFYRKKVEKMAGTDTSQKGFLKAPEKTSKKEDD